MPTISGKAITSIILACVSLLLPCVGVLTGIIAIVLGYIAIKDIQTKPEQFTGRGAALSGIIIGSLALLVWGVLGVLMLLVMFGGNSAAAPFIYTLF